MTALCPVYFYFDLSPSIRFAGCSARSALGEIAANAHICRTAFIAMLGLSFHCLPNARASSALVGLKIASAQDRAKPLGINGPSRASGSTRGSA